MSPANPNCSLSRRGEKEFQAGRGCTNRCFIYELLQDKTAFRENYVPIVDFSKINGVVNACEMKYSRDAYMIDAKTEKELSEKLAVFSGVTKTRKAVHLTIVSAHGLLRNSHSGRVQSTIDLDDLFKEAT